VQDDVSRVNPLVTRSVTATLKASTMKTIVIVLLLTMANFKESTTSAAPPTRDEVIEAMHSYAGESTPGVDCTTLSGKIVCGYQGWFTTPTDGAERGWTHYSRKGRFEPGHCSIDLWPDVRDLDEDERFDTPFRHANGSVAQVFSSHNTGTVVRHFEWMREFNIDGAFVQRFAVETRDPRALRHCNQVLASCREGANRHGRTYAVMYDLSGLQAGGIQHVIDDWKLLVDRMRIGRDPRDKAYLRENGKPLVAVWGIGFNDDRKYTLTECEALIRFLKHDPDYGGCTVMLGVPTGWRTLDRDSIRDASLHRVLEEADIVSPWTVGRYATPQDVVRHADRSWKPDIAWCAERKLAYLPVVFPGFSWHNMRPEAPLNQIPRRNGEFLWSQFVEAKRAGASMIYVAMFDEMDEGTAIFKCTNEPPAGASPFVTSQGLATDHYLWLTGQGGRMLRGEIPATDRMPTR
jgi:hypothetical protein